MSHGSNRCPDPWLTPRGRADIRRGSWASIGTGRDTAQERQNRRYALVTRPAPPAGTAQWQGFRGVTAAWVDPGDGPNSTMAALSCVSRPLGSFRGSFPDVGLGVPAPTLSPFRDSHGPTPRNPGIPHEAHVPTQQPTPQAQAWLSHPHADPRRPQHRAASPGQGTPPSLGLTGAATCRFAPPPASPRCTGPVAEPESAASSSSRRRRRPRSPRSASLPRGRWVPLSHGTVPSAACGRRSR